MAEQATRQARRAFVVAGNGQTVATYNRASERRTAAGMRTETQSRTFAPGASFTSTISEATFSTMTDDDAHDVTGAALRYVRVLDSTRSRKRFEDVGQDVAQDACLAFASLIARLPVAAYDVATGHASHFLYTPAEAAESDAVDVAPRLPFTISRSTIARWSVTDAARHNGLRMDDVRDADGTEMEPGKTLGQGYAVNRSQHVAVATLRTAHGDPARAGVVARVLAEAPAVVRTYLAHGGNATDAAQALYGGVRGSERARVRLADALTYAARETLDNIEVMVGACATSAPDPDGLL